MDRMRAYLWHAWLKEQAERTSYRRLAELVGLNHATIYRIINGNVFNPTLRTMDKIDEAIRLWDALHEGNSMDDQGVGTAVPDNPSQAAYLKAKAWDALWERLAYLNQFAGNRSENKRFTEMVEKIWESVCGRTLEGV